MTSRPGTCPPAQAGHGSNGESPPHPCGEADLDAYIQRLVDTAPPLTAEQRDTLALLLRRPRPQITATTSSSGGQRPTGNAG